ncbi:MAG: hypothetical protein LBP95_01090 [Deltaproteobacteria bacterium]|jgi:hypothetical protein|nr:hypothetical protein [Deltaproteobacteria bacterium]
MNEKHIRWKKTLFLPLSYPRWQYCFRFPAAARRNANPAAQAPQSRAMNRALRYVITPATVI